MSYRGQKPRPIYSGYISTEAHQNADARLANFVLGKHDSLSESQLGEGIRYCLRLRGNTNKQVAKDECAEKYLLELLIESHEFLRARVFLECAMMDEDKKNHLSPEHLNCALQALRTIKIQELQEQTDYSKFRDKLLNSDIDLEQCMHFADPEQRNYPLATSALKTKKLNALQVASALARVAASEPNGDATGENEFVLTAWLNGADPNFVFQTDELGEVYLLEWFVEERRYSVDDKCKGIHSVKAKIAPEVLERCLLAVLANNDSNKEKLLIALAKKAEQPLKLAATDTIFVHKKMYALLDCCIRNRRYVVALEMLRQFPEPSQYQLQFLLIAACASTYDETCAKQRFEFIKSLILKCGGLDASVCEAFRFTLFSDGTNGGWQEDSTHFGDWLRGCSAQTALEPTKQTALVPSSTPISESSAQTVLVPTLAPIPESPVQIALVPTAAAPVSVPSAQCQAKKRYSILERIVLVEKNYSLAIQLLHEFPQSTFTLQRIADIYQEFGNNLDVVGFALLRVAYSADSVLRQKLVSLPVDVLQEPARLATEIQSIAPTIPCDGTIVVAPIGQNRS